MQTSFYQASISCYLQTLSSTAGVLSKGLEHASATGMDPQEIVAYRLHETMLPFSFQVISVWHHSLGAVRAMRAGTFAPPPAKPGIDYAGLIGLIDEAIEQLREETPESMEVLSGKRMTFDLGETKIPFITDNFLATFSKPNVYFHATTTYSVLRQLGTPLGKRDYIGEMKIGY